MFKTIEVMITREQIKQYAEASGDFNPIHTDPAAAEKAGLPGCIAHGMLVMALGGRALEEWGITSLDSYEVRFQAMTLPDELLFMKGMWSDEASGKGTLIIENETGEIKMKGAFTAKRL